MRFLLLIFVGRMPYLNHDSFGKRVVPFGCSLLTEHSLLSLFYFRLTSVINRNPWLRTLSLPWNPVWSEYLWGINNQFRDGLAEACFCFLSCTSAPGLWTAEWTVTLLGNKVSPATSPSSIQTSSENSWNEAVTQACLGTCHHNIEPFHLDGSACNPLKEKAQCRSGGR